jgi:hypothetical protein
MASYTDIIPQFNPYIQQLPIEAMVQVGMEKQKRYDEGVQKLQTQIDNIAGIEVLRPQDKTYLQSKLNQLGNNLRGVAAGDFSNFQLVSSVGGMIGQIGKDKIVQAAVQSTAWDKQQRALMEEDRKKGTLAPENETNYSKKLRSYYESGVVDEQGNPVKFSSSYIPHFDIWKFTKETFDAIKPDNLSWDQVYETDTNGNPKIDPITKKPIYSPVMIRMEKEGIVPERVRSTLNQIFSDPRVVQQLNITGEYNFSGLNENALRERLISQKESVTGELNDKINELTLKKNLAKDTEKGKFQEQIDSLKNSLSTVNENYSELEQTAYKNPDYVRGYLYRNDVRERYTNMFGWSKTKTQTMDNPGWNANFKLQQEALEQDRWEKRFAFDEKWKLAEYEQRERLAKRKGAKLDADGNVIVGGGGTGIEQADQPSDIDVVYKLESDYNAAATDFVNSSDSFLWETIFSKVPGNEQKLADLLSKGNTREKSISILLNNAATNSKETPEAFKARWGTAAETEFNRLNPKDITPDIRDAYNLYKKSKRNFDTMSSIVKEINSATEANLGSDFTKANLTTDIKPQKVVLYGKEYNLSKEDVYDLAVYLRGHQSALGFLNDEGARKAANSAEARIKARGNESLLEAVLRQNVTSGGPLGIITMAARTIGTPGRFVSGFTDAWRNATGNKDTYTDIDLSQVDKVYERIDNDDYTNVMKKKAEIIKNMYGIKPNVKMGVLTGDTETDKSTIFNLRRFAGASTAGQKQNLSPDFSKFAESISGDIAGMNIETQVIMDANNNPQVEIVSYDSDGERIGGMTIQPDEAANIGLDVSTLYEPRDVSMLRNYIKNKSNQTSAGDPKDVSTYVSGDAYFEKPSFTGMANSPYDIKANIKYANGKYYSYIYVSDGTKRTVYTSPGSDNLTDVYTNLVQNVTPAWAQAILSTK